MSAAGWLAPDKAEGWKWRPGGHELVKIIVILLLLGVDLGHHKSSFPGLGPQGSMWGNPFSKARKSTSQLLETIHDTTQAKDNWTGCDGSLRRPGEAHFCPGDPFDISATLPS